MADHLDKALQALALAQENVRIEALHRPALRLAQTHALIDIAESLRALRPLTPSATNLEVVNFPLSQRHLAELPLEHVGGYDEDDEAAS